MMPRSLCAKLKPIFPLVSSSMRMLTSTSINYPSHVKIVEVSPRDGLQNIKDKVPTDVKVGLINRLSETGISYIEPTSFVSPKWVPQMEDAAEVISRINRKSGVTYAVPIPNLKGLEMARKHGVEEIAIFSAASESFSMKNTNATIRKILDGNRPICDRAKELGIKVRGYVSCVLGCPYEGDIDPKKVASIAKEMYDLGCYEISLGDTIGVGTPGSTQKLLNEVRKVVPVQNLAVHFHDTYGQALSNILIALQQGICVVDSSVAGLGGCPYAKGASGNVATEDVVYMLHGMNITTGIDLDSLVDVSKYLCSNLGIKTQSRTGSALLSKRSRM